MADLTDIYSTLNPEFFRDFESGRFLMTKTDLVTIPNLIQYISLREFAEEEEYDFSHFRDDQKIEIGVLFLKRDGYLIKKNDGYYFDIKKLLDINSFNTKLVSMINALKDRVYLNRDPETKLINIDYMTNANKIILLETYFFNRYRVQSSAEHYEKYLINLTDINLNKNKFTVKTNIKSFIIEIFSNWLNTKKGSIPFSTGYYCSIKDSLQVKNEQVRFNYLEAEIKDFFADLKLLYDNTIEVRDIKLITDSTASGADTLTVIIILEILKETSQIVIRTQN